MTGHDSDPARQAPDDDPDTQRPGVTLTSAESDARFRTMVEFAPVGLGEIDPATGRWRRANPALCRILGYTERELIGQPATIVGPAQAAPRPPSTDGGDEPLAAPVIRRFRRKDGLHVWILTNTNLVEDDQGRPARLLCSVEDVSDRIAAEEEHRRLATAVEQAAEAIVITDAEPRIVYVNPAFERISGYTKGEVLGQNPRVLKSGQHEAAFYEQMWEALSAGRAWSGELVNRHKDGSLYFEEATISPVVDGAGRTTNYVAVKRDVTHERQVERQFRQAQKLEALGQLAGGVAHDFNNLLSVIKGHAELVGTVDDLPRGVRDAVDEIARAADSAATLTRQLLLFSRGQALQLRTVDLNDIVANMSRLLGRILGEEVRIEIRPGPRPLTVHVDSGMVDQVLLNFAVNARDAMPKGGVITIETSVHVFGEPAEPPEGGRAGAFVCLRVSDTGEGITPQVLPRIFEPFFTTKDVGRGTGLGLATVLGIVQQHHGWVNVESTPEVGTTFRVYLPHVASAPPEADRDTERIVMQGGHETILLVEDDPALRRMVRLILAQLGYRVLEARTGRDALEIWTQHQSEVRLLLTDIVMPDGMSGLELAELLLSHDPGLKVIYASGYSADLATSTVPMREGVNFLTKPFSPRTLADAVRGQLTGRTDPWA